MTNTMTKTTIEAIDAMMFLGIDGIALDAVISGQPDQIAAAKLALSNERADFMKNQNHQDRIRVARIASAAQLLR